LICEIAGGVATRMPSMCKRNSGRARVRFVPHGRGFDFSASCGRRDVSHSDAPGFCAAETESISLTGQGDEAATTFIVPTWRIDVRLEEDLIEEIRATCGL